MNRRLTKIVTFSILVVLFFSLPGSVSAQVMDSSGFDDPLFQYLAEGDYLYFIFACYYQSMGNMFVGLIVFFFGAVVYLRLKSLMLVGLLYILLGGPFLALFFEFSALPVLLTILGIAGVFIDFVLVWRSRH